MNETLENDATTTQVFNITVPVQDDTTVLGVIYLVVSVLVMATNGVVIFVICKTRKLHLPTLWIIASMAVWDFLMGLHFLLFAVPSAFLNYFAYSDKLIGFSSATRSFIHGQTFWIVLMMVVDRYIAVTRPLSYTRIATKKVFGLAMLISVLFSFVRVLLIVLPADKFFFDKIYALCVISNTQIGGLSSVLPGSFAFVFIGVCYGRMLTEFISGRRQVHPRNEAETQTRNIGKFTLMTFLSTMVFCLAYVPAVVATLQRFRGREQMAVNFARFVIISVLSNSVWNVLIFPATYRPFRDALLSRICASYYRRQRQAEIRATFCNRAGEEVVAIETVNI